MKAKDTIFDIAKKPFVGEIIIFFFIFLTLSAMAGTLNYFGLGSEGKKELFNWFLYISIFYIILSLCIRVVILFKKSK